MTRKSLLKATVLCLAMMACCVTFSACSSDENEPETIITNELTTIKAEYSVSLSEDWYRFFDIEVTYTSETGVKTILLTEDWNFDMNIPYTAGPDEFVCQVTAKPKADMPAIEENASYLLEENIQVKVNGILGGRNDEFQSILLKSSISLSKCNGTKVLEAKSIALVISTALLRGKVSATTI